MIVWKREAQVTNYTSEFSPCYQRLAYKDLSYFYGAQSVPIYAVIFTFSKSASCFLQNYRW